MYGTAVFLLVCAGCLLVLPSPKTPSGSDGDSLYSSVGTEEEETVGAAGLEDAEQGHIGSERARGRNGSMAHEKPVSLAVSWPVVVATAVVLAFYLGLEMGFAGFLSSYVSSALGAGAEAGASTASIFWGTFTAGRFLAVALVAPGEPAIKSPSFSTERAQRYIRS